MDILHGNTNAEYQNKYKRNVQWHKQQQQQQKDSKQNSKVLPSVQKNALKNYNLT